MGVWPRGAEPALSRPCGRPLGRGVARHHASARPDREGYAELRLAEGEEGVLRRPCGFCRRASRSGAGLDCGRPGANQRHGDGPGRLSAARRRFPRGGGVGPAGRDGQSAHLRSPPCSAFPGGGASGRYVGPGFAPDDARSRGSAGAKDCRRGRPDPLGARTDPRGRFRKDRRDVAAAGSSRFSRPMTLSAASAAGSSPTPAGCCSTRREGARGGGIRRLCRRRYTERDSDVAGAVRIMTVHKAEGLGFDLVILPDLQGQTLAKRRSDLAVQQGPDRSVQWVMDLPALDLAMTDPVLAAHVEESRAEACYENLCLLVSGPDPGPRRPWYVVTEPVGGSQSANFPRLLQGNSGRSLDGGRSAMVPGHSLRDRPRGGKRRDAPGVGIIPPVPVPVRRPARRPLGRPHRRRPRGGSLRPRGRHRGSDFGTAVHALLAEVRMGRRGRGGSAWPRSGKKQTPRPRKALSCLAAPGLAEIWQRPAGSGGGFGASAVSRWCYDGAWVTGIFDLRVMIVRDGGGRAQRLTVWDFKTDAVEPAGVPAAIERHGPPAANLPAGSRAADGTARGGRRRRAGADAAASAGRAADADCRAGAPGQRPLPSSSRSTPTVGGGGMSGAGHDDLQMDPHQLARLHPRTVAPARDRDGEGFAVARIGRGGRKHLPRRTVLVDDEVDFGEELPRCPPNAGAQNSSKGDRSRDRRAGGGEASPFSTIGLF